MVHKLFIQFALDPPEPVSKTNFNIHLKLTNIGDSVFPGGELTKFMLSVQQTTQERAPSSLEKIPPINVNESIDLKPQPFLMFADGPAWVSVELKASDGVEVNLYQNPEHNMGRRWTNVFPIKKQEYEIIINLLRQIVELLEKREKK